jgi:hypothetical protein
MEVWMYFVLVVIFVSSQVPSAPILTLNELSEEDCNAARANLQVAYKSSGYADHVKILCLPGTTATILPSPLF